MKVPHRAGKLRRGQRVISRGQWQRLISRRAVEPTCSPGKPPEPRLPDDEQCGTLGAVDQGPDRLGAHDLVVDLDVGVGSTPGGDGRLDDLLEVGLVGAPVRARRQRRVARAVRLPRVQHVEPPAGAQGLVERDAERPQRRLRPVDTHDHPAVDRGAARRLVTDDQHRAAGVRDDLHGDGSHAGAAEHAVAHRAHDHEGRGARGVDEGLARVAVTDAGGDLERGVDRVGPRHPVGDEPLGVVGHHRRPVGQLAEPEHGQVGREGVQHVQRVAPCARHLGGPRDRGHGQWGPVDPDDDSCLGHLGFLRSRGCRGGGARQERQG